MPVDLFKEVKMKSSRTPVDLFKKHNISPNSEEFAPYGTNLPGQLASGLANVGRGFYNTAVARPASFLNEDIINPTIGRALGFKLNSIPDLPVENKNQTISQAGNLLGEMGGLLGTGSAITRGVPNILKTAKYISPVTRALIAGATSALGSRDDRGENALVGAALNPAFEAIPGGLNQLKNSSKIFNKLLRGFVKGKGDSGAIKADEFKRNLEFEPPGISMPLADLANSAMLRSLHTTIEVVPFSGGSAPYDSLNEYLRGLKNKLGEGVPENIDDINDYAYKQYEKSYKNSMQNTSKAFNKLAKEASKKNVRLNDDAYQDAINDADTKIRDRKAGKPKVYAEIKNMIDELRNPGLSTITGTRNKLADNFTEAAELAQRLNGMWLDNYDDPIKRGFISNLKKGIEKSIEDSTHEVPELARTRKAANKARQYQGEFERLNNANESPFYKIHKSPLNTDTGKFINSYIKNSTKGNENFRATKNLFSKLSPEDRKIIGYHLLKDEDLSGQVKKLSQLSPKQREVIYGENKPITDKLIDSLKIFPEGKYPKYTPKTGFPGVKAILGSAAAAVHPWAVLPLFAGARASQGLLRSNMLKRLYLKALQEGEKSAGIRPSPSPSPVLNNNFLRSVLPTEIAIHRDREDR